MLDTVKINHVQHISFTQSRLTDAVSVILSELLSYEHPSKYMGNIFLLFKYLYTFYELFGDWYSHKSGVFNNRYALIGNESDYYGIPYKG